MSLVLKNRKYTKILAIILAIFLSIIIVILAIIPPMLMRSIVNTHMEVETYSPDDYGIEAKELTLETEDSLSLAAWEVEKKNPKGIVILLSGIQNPSVTAFWGYSKMLQDNGYSSLLIEMRSHGASEGEKVWLGTTEYLDVLAGVEHIKSQEEYQNTPIIVWGTSMGGVTAINAIGEIADIDGIISGSAYSSWPDVFSDNMVNMGLPPFLAAAEKPFVSLYMGLQLGFDKLTMNPLNQIGKLDGRPALLMHSTEDSQVPYKSFERLIKNAPDNITTFIREGDQHFICFEEYFENPIEDKEFSGAVLDFLASNF